MIKLNDLESIDFDKYQSVKRLQRRILGTNTTTTASTTIQQNAKQMKQKKTQLLLQQQQLLMNKHIGELFTQVVQ